MTEEQKQEGENKEEKEDIEAIKSGYEKQIEELQKELIGHKNKEYNFKKLRDMTSQEVEALTEKEKELIKRQEHLEEEQRSWSTNIIESHKDDALNVLAGDDADLREKTLFHFNRIKDEAVSKEDINKKMRDAYLLANGGKSGGVDSLARAVAYHGGRGTAKTKSELTESQKYLAAQLGITDEDIKKFNK